MACYNCSLILRVDELETPSFKQMGFYEFIHAIAHIAEVTNFDRLGTDRHLDKSPVSSGTNV